MPYDALGNYIPGDEEPSMDQIRYELTKAGSKSEAQKSPFTGLYGPFIEKVVAPYVEPALSVVSGMAAPVIAGWEALGKGAVTKGLETVGAITPAERLELLTKTPSIEQRMADLTYMPRTEQGRENLQAIGKAFEESKIPPFWPVAGGKAPTRPMLTPDDVRVMGAQVAKTKREVQNIPTDFPNARQGIIAQDQFGQPTIGAKLGMAANKAQAVGEALELPGVVDTAPIGAVRYKGEGQMLVPRSPNRDITVPSADTLGAGNVTEVLRKASPDVEMLRETIQPADLIETYNSFFLHREDPATGQYVMPRDAQITLSNGFNDYVSQRFKDMYPNAPSANDAKEAFDFTHNARERKEKINEFYNDYLKQPGTRAIAQEYGIDLPDLDVFQQRIKAAREAITGPLFTHLQRYLGTKEDPLLQLASQGFTMRPAEQIIREAHDFIVGSPSTYRAMQERRAAAGFNPKGEFADLIEKKRNQLVTLQQEYQPMLARRTELFNLAHEQNPDADPADTIPEYGQLTNVLDSKSREIARVEQELDNLRLADAYETLSDVAVKPTTVGETKKEMRFGLQQFFPQLGEKAKPEEKLFDVRQYQLKDLGMYDIARKLVDDIMLGRLPVEDIKKSPLVKFVREAAESRVAEERAERLAQATYIQDLLDYYKDSVKDNPNMVQFGNAKFEFLTANMPKEDVIRKASAATESLDHCVGQGGPGRGRKHFLTGDNRDYTPIVNPINGKVPKGSSGGATSYVNSVLRGDETLVNMHDTETGIIESVIQLKHSINGNYNISMNNGYKNGPIKPEYRQAMKDFLNSIADKINQTDSSYTPEHAGVYDLKTNSNVGLLRRVLNMSPDAFKALPLNELPRFVTLEDVKALKGETRALATRPDELQPLVARRDELRQLIEDAHREGLPTDDLYNELQDIDQRVRRMEAQQPQQPAQNLPVMGTGVMDMMRGDFEPDNPFSMLYDHPNDAVNGAYVNALEHLDDGREFRENPDLAIQELRTLAQNTLDSEEFAEQYFGLTTSQQQIQLARLLNSHAQIIEEHLGPPPQAPALREIANEMQQAPAIPDFGAILPAAPQDAALNALEGYQTILRVNNNFAGPEGLDRLRVLLAQLRLREGQDQYGLVNLDNEQRSAVVRAFDNLLEARQRQGEQLFDEVQNEPRPEQPQQLPALEGNNLTRQAAVEQVLYDVRNYNNWLTPIDVLQETLPDHLTELYSGMLAEAPRAATPGDAVRFIENMLDDINNERLDIDNYEDAVERIRDLINFEGWNATDAYEGALSPLRDALQEQLNLIRDAQNQAPEQGHANGGRINMAQGGSVHISGLQNSNQVTLPVPDKYGKAFGARLTGNMPLDKDLELEAYLEGIASKFKDQPAKYEVPEYGVRVIKRFSEGGGANLHPLVVKGIAEGRIDPADAKWLSEYARAPGSSQAETGKVNPDMSEKMENYMRRIRSGEATGENFKERFFETRTAPPSTSSAGSARGALGTPGPKNLGGKYPEMRQGGQLTMAQMRAEMMTRNHNA